MAAANEPFRNLGFAEDAAVFASASQNVRVLSEGWMAMHGFCPSCGAEPLAAFKANTPVADFHCAFSLALSLSDCGLSFLQAIDAWVYPRPTAPSQRLQRQRRHPRPGRFERRRSSPLQSRRR